MIENQLPQRIKQSTQAACLAETKESFSEEQRIIIAEYYRDNALTLQRTRIALQPLSHRGKRTLRYADFLSCSQDLRQDQNSAAGFGMAKIETFC